MNRNRSRGGEGRRNNDEKRRVEERRRPAFDDDRRPPVENDRKINRRKNTDDVPEKRREVIDEVEEKLPKASASVYDRPRTPPKISRPVSLKDKEKFSYKVEKPKQQQQNSQEYEYYDDESQVESSSKPTTTSTTTLKPSTRYTRKQQTYLITTRRPSTTVKTTTTTVAPEEFYYYDDEYDESSAAPTTTPSTTTTVKSKVDVLDLSKINKLKSLNDRLSAYKKTALESGFEAVSKFATTTSTTTTPLPITTSRKPLPSIIGKKFANQQTLFESTTEPQDIDVRFRGGGDVENDQKSFVKIYKRPFLPSRGGNPYKARGLSPVGPSSLTHEGNNPESSSYRTTLEDIYNEEYDVELNDALNPQLKPLTSSRGISTYTSSFNNRDGLSSQSRQNIQRADAPKYSVKTTTVTTTTTTVSPPQYDEYEEYVEYI